MVRSTFYGFEASKSALFANQKLLDIAGNNLANAKTDGYTRQRVETTSTYYSSTNSRIASSTIGSAGAGVTVLGVSQIRDAFVDKSYRDENALMYYYSKSSEIETEIKNVFPEATNVTSTSGLVGAFETLQSNLNSFLSSPTSESEANIVKSSFSSIAQILKKSDTELTTIYNRQLSDLDTTVSRTNELLEQIQHYNSTIASEKNAVSQVSSQYFSPNELMDKRNLLLDELSQYASINVSTNSDSTVNVSFVDASGAETQVVNGNDVTLAPAKLTRDTDATTKEWKLKLATNTRNADGTISTGTKDATFKEGSMKASVEVLTGDGSTLTADGNRIQGIPYYRNKLNTFAQKLADVVNKAIPSTTDDKGTIEKDAGGNTVYKTFLTNGTDDANNTTGITAANISVSSTWSKNPGYFIFSKAQNAVDYASKLKDTLGSKSTEFETNMGATDKDKFTGSFSEYVTDTAARASTDVSFNNSRYTATKAVANDFLSTRESNSGVQRDEETANMLEFQKAYQASARMMTVMDNILDVLINQIGARIAQ